MQSISWNLVLVIFDFIGKNTLKFEKYLLVTLTASLYCLHQSTDDDCQKPSHSYYYFIALK